MPLDHEALVIDTFLGQFDRNNEDACPPNYFPATSNLDYEGDAVSARKRFTLFCNTGQTFRRAFIYNAKNDKVFIIGLDRSGFVYYQQISPTAEIAIQQGGLTLDHDMDMVSFNNRAYVVTANRAGYAGDQFFTFDGVTWKVAGGLAPTTNATLAISGTAGKIEAGVKYFGVCFVTDTGFITPPTPTNPTFVTFPGNKKALLTNIPLGAGPSIVARRIVATRTVATTPPPSNGLESFESFFVPGGYINDNTTTSIEVDFIDAELLDNSSYLLDIYTTPPGGSSICVFHNRLVITAAKGASIDEVSGVAVSNVNDPETFSMVDGIIIVDPSKNLNITCADTTILQTGLTDSQVYRDSLYLFRLNGAYGVSDNGDVPSTWPIVTIDEAYGSFLHGVVTVLDTGGINIEYIVVANQSGIFVFTGLFNEPAITWNIEFIWSQLVTVPYSSSLAGLLAGPSPIHHACESKMHFANDSLNKRLYCVVGRGDKPYSPHEVGPWDDIIKGVPNTVLFLDYSKTEIFSEESYSKVKWSVWDFFLDWVNPYSGILYNNGQEIKFLISNNAFPTGLGGGAQPHWLEYGGPGTLIEQQWPRPYFKTHLIGDKKGTQHHFGAVKYRVVGNGLTDTIFITYASDVERQRFTNLADITVPPTSVKQPEILCNFISALATFYVSGDWFIIRKMVIYYRPVYNSIPR